VTGKRTRGMYKRILIATDGSKAADKAFQHALDLASLAKSDLHAMSVAEDLPKFAGTTGEVEDYKRRADEFFKPVFETMKSQAERKGVNLQAHLRYGHEIDTIVRFAQEKTVDLLVIGFVGYSNIMKKLMGNWGSTAQNLTRLAPCNVLVVK
jgi:nucleotide-binding universal stress UspA family protein